MKKVAHQRPPPKTAEVAAKPKPKSAPKPHKPAGTAYALAPAKPDSVLGRRVGAAKSYTIYAPSVEAGLMQRAMGRLDRALESLEHQVKTLEAPGAFADDIRGPLILAAQEVQGQLNSGNAHADAWFKNRPNEMKDAKSALQEKTARFEALIQRASVAGIPIRLPLQVPQRY